ncbi:hypothetical protein CGZ69_18365 [Streptomyces peucetius subsp. caesius ATCC 27952]|nr:hypothetical protein CGZ69_18365 [Streptomyces peucetius subsp. caesius ATCC 27952]
MVATDTGDELPHRSRPRKMACPGAPADGDAGGHLEVGPEGEGRSTRFELYASGAPAGPEWSGVPAEP